MDENRAIDESAVPDAGTGDRGGVNRRDWLEDETWEDAIPDLIDPDRPDQVSLWELSAAHSLLRDDLQEVRLQLAALERTLGMMEHTWACAGDTFRGVEWQPDPASYHLWRRLDTGQVYAVRMIAERIVGCQPVEGANHTARELWDVRYHDAGLVAWAARHKDEFEVLPVVTEDQRSGELKAHVRALERQQAAEVLRMVYEVAKVLREAEKAQEEKREQPQNE